MAEVDIQGSLAHADMLESIGIISSEDKISIEKGMARILEEIRSGAFVWSLDLEDVHLNIEKRLVELIGDAGKRLHTGRSRNDQVATDIRLWLRAEINIAIDLLHQLRGTLAALALEPASTILPSFAPPPWAPPDYG